MNEMKADAFDSAAAGWPGDDATSPDAGSRQWRILLVEDDATIAMFVEDSLRELGHSVVATGATESEALALLDKHRPELLMIDVGLGRDGDGIRVAALARERYGTPSVIMTGASDGGTFLRAEESGARAFLRKPFGQRQIEGVLSHFSG